MFSGSYEVSLKKQLSIEHEIVSGINTVYRHLSHTYCKSRGTGSLSTMLDCRSVAKKLRTFVECVKILLFGTKAQGMRQEHYASRTICHVL